MNDDALPMTPDALAALVSSHREYLGFVERRVGDQREQCRRARARDALRKQVVRSCGTCADHGCLDCTCKR